jgi:hypothetical protein
MITQLDAKWEAQYKKLVEHKAEFGNCLVPPLATVIQQCQIGYVNIEKGRNEQIHPT